MDEVISNVLVKIEFLEHLPCHNLKEAACFYHNDAKRNKLENPSGHLVSFEILLNDHLLINKLHHKQLGHCSVV